MYFTYCKILGIEGEMNLSHCRDIQMNLTQFASQIVCSVNRLYILNTNQPTKNTVNLCLTIKGDRTGV